MGGSDLNNNLQPPATPPLPSTSHFTQLQGVLLHGPGGAAHAVLTPQHAVGVVLGLQRSQARVVVAPEGLFVVWFIGVGLVDVAPGVGGEVAQGLGQGVGQVAGVDGVFFLEVGEGDCEDGD